MFIFEVRGISSPLSRRTHIPFLPHQSIDIFEQILNALLLFLDFTHAVFTLKQCEQILHVFQQILLAFHRISQLTL
ncbi:MAG TPA: hypothetical protein DDZ90_03195, partial [Planctomycetaceae bacterium]|nr:hypothetical protein [Planctomycetaceae bacterium]